MRMRSPRSYISRTFPLAMSGRSFTGGTCRTLPTGSARSRAGTGPVMKVLLIIIIVLVVVAIAVFAARAAQRRKLEKERERERLATEAEDHTERGERARQAAARHDERAGEAEGRIEEI